MRSQYLYSSASGGSSTSFDWLPDTWKEGVLKRLEVSAVMRNIAVGPPNPSYTSGAQVLFSELNNGLPLMEIATTNIPQPINGTSLIATHWYPWKGSLRLDSGLQYGMLVTGLPLFEMTNPADWEFLFTVHWEIETL
jgi:hypothetical protein